ncbi:hypothetical protein [Agrobacterium tumefaciens]|jgi:hypothetical protein|uniref:hypothetical protein n=1 Tax=Agrobacterium tumefaciens TaxID=358 RepID=UPI000AA84885
MNSEYFYQPVMKPTLLDRARDFYWSKQGACDAAMFVGVVAMVVTVLVQMA